jgi:hypothetical protein
MNATTSLFGRGATIDPSPAFQSREPIPQMIQSLPRLNLLYDRSTGFEKPG